jgi:hypothetical protein
MGEEDGVLPVQTQTVLKLPNSHRRQVRPHQRLQPEGEESHRGPPLLIQNALDIIQMRKKNKDLVGKTETIVEILEQKKEMFLVTMTHGII